MKHVPVRQHRRVRVEGTQGTLIATTTLTETGGSQERESVLGEKFWNVEKYPRSA